MQTAVRLLSNLDNEINAIKAHLQTMDDHTLRTLLKRMPAKSAGGSAEMTMTILIYREMEIRMSNQGSNVLPFAR